MILNHYDDDCYNHKYGDEILTYLHSSAAGHGLTGAVDLGFQILYVSDVNRYDMDYVGRIDTVTGQHGCAGWSWSHKCC